MVMVKVMEMIMVKMTWVAITKRMAMELEMVMVMVMEMVMEMEVTMQTVMEMVMVMAYKCNDFGKALLVFSLCELHGISISQTIERFLTIPKMTSQTSKHHVEMRRRMRMVSKHLDVDHHLCVHRHYQHQHTHTHTHTHNTYITHIRQYCFKVAPFCNRRGFGRHSSFKFLQHTCRHTYTDTHTHIYIHTYIHRLIHKTYYEIIA